MADTIFRVGLFETLPILRLTTLPVGTHTFVLSPAGNSLLSSIWVKSIGLGGSVKATWYDYSVGSTPDPAAKYVLDEHPLILPASAPIVSRRTVTRIHNQAYVDIVVADAPAEVSLIVSVVSDFPMEISLEGDNGIEAASGTPNHYVDAGGIETTPGAAQVLLGPLVVPVGKRWRLRRVTVPTRAYGSFVLTEDGSKIALGVTSPAESNASFAWDPYREVSAGKSVILSYKQIAGGPAIDISAFLQITELDA